MKNKLRVLTALATLCVIASSAMSHPHQTPRANYIIEVKSELTTPGAIQKSADNILRYISQHAKKEGAENYIVKIETFTVSDTSNPFEVLTVRADELDLMYVLNTPVLDHSNILARIREGLTILLQQQIDVDMQKP